MIGQIALVSWVRQRRSAATTSLTCLAGRSEAMVRVAKLSKCDSTMCWFKI